MRVLAGVKNLLTRAANYVLKRKTNVQPKQPEFQVSTAGGHYRAATFSPEFLMRQPITVPEMIDISGKVGIMKEEVTVGLFRRVMRNYRPKAYHANLLPKQLQEEIKLALLVSDKPDWYEDYTIDELLRKLRGPASIPFFVSRYGCEAEDSILGVSLYEAREFANRLSTLTGRRFRVQTNAEWEMARSRLLGNHWTWTDTRYQDFPDQYILRHLCNDHPSYWHPGIRYFRWGIRLVEVK